MQSIKLFVNMVRADTDIHAARLRPRPAESLVIRTYTQVAEATQ